MKPRSNLNIDYKLSEQEKNLRQAAANGDFEAVEKLFSEGVDIHSRGPDTKKTALHWAAEYGRLKIGKFLISKGARIDSKDARGNTPLNCAIQSKKGKLIDRVNLIEQLILCKADPLEPNLEGKTPLMNFSLIRDNKELLAKPHLNSQVRAIIRKMKEQVVEVACRNEQSVTIKPNGEIFFGNVLQAFRHAYNLPHSAQDTVTLIDPITLTPHR